jgi:chitin disaccharide deacetylase
MDLACEFSLPVMLPAESEEHAMGFPARKLAADEGILSPDHVVEARGRPTRAVIEHAVFNLAPGVTVLSVSPAIDAPEIRGLDPHWSGRVEDYLVTTHDPGIKDLVDRSDAQIIGFAELRNAQRKIGASCAEE